jgi:hypothetical protein
MILGACFVLLILPAVASARPDNRDRVCIYKHDNFQGHEQCFRPGDEISDLKHVDVNSIRVFGHARVMLYEDRDFKGRSMAVSSDMSDLDRAAVSKSKTWHDNVGSLRVVPDYAYYERDRIYQLPADEIVILRSKPAGVPNEGACVYEKPHFEGRVQCWSTNTDISDLSFADWRDKISSVRVFGHSRLLGYKNSDFGGERIILDHDVSDLGDIPMRAAGNWNDEIQSLTVQVEH